MTSTAMITTHPRPTATAATSSRKALLSLKICRRARVMIMIVPEGRAILSPLWVGPQRVDGRALAGGQCGRRRGPRQHVGRELGVVRQLVVELGEDRAGVRRREQGRSGGHPQLPAPA